MHILVSSDYFSAVVLHAHIGNTFKENAEQL